MSTFNENEHPRGHPSNPGRFGEKPQSSPEAGLPAPRPTVDQAFLREVRELEHNDSLYLPGAHPTLGGLNWGVQYSEHWGDWSVNHAVWGSTSTKGGQVFYDGSPTPLPEDITRWSADTEDADQGVELWTVRDEVTAGLVAQGRRPKDSVRVRATFVDDETIRIGPYDWPDDFVPFDVRRPARA